MKDFDKESTKLDLLVSFIILGLLALIVYFILSGIFSFAEGILDGEIGKSGRAVVARYSPFRSERYQICSAASFRVSASE